MDVVGFWRDVRGWVEEILLDFAGEVRFLLDYRKLSRRFLRDKYL